MASQFIHEDTEAQGGTGTVQDDTEDSNPGPSYCPPPAAPQLQLGQCSGTGVPGTGVITRPRPPLMPSSGPLPVQECPSHHSGLAAKKSCVGPQL